MSVNTAEATTIMMKVLLLRNCRKMGGLSPEPKSHINMIGLIFFFRYVVANKSFVKMIDKIVRRLLGMDGSSEPLLVEMISGDKDR